SHSLCREAERPIRGQSFRTMCLSGNSSCNTTPHKFGVVNLVAQHDEAADQKLSGDGHLRLGFITTMKQSFVELLQLRVTASGRLAGFIEQKTQQARTLFADAAHALAVRRLSFNTVETNVSGDPAGRGKARDGFQRVTQRQGGQQANPWMRAQQL